MLAAGCGDPAPADPDASPGPDASPPPAALCVFDYDLTLSSNICEQAIGVPELHCRLNGCITYDWYEQCLGLKAREAVAECVARGAAIGIASHANVDRCWDDKVIPILTESQFPEWTGSPRYGGEGFYPALDDRTHWNCDDCAYTMDGSIAKPVSISRVMRYYGLDPNAAADQARVIFWDDSPGNVTAVTDAMPAVHVIAVPRFGDRGHDGGCGLTETEIAAGWAAWEAGGP